MQDGNWHIDESSKLPKYRKEYKEKNNTFQVWFKGGKCIWIQLNPVISSDS